MSNDKAREFEAQEEIRRKERQRLADFFDLKWRDWRESIPEPHADVRIAIDLMQDVANTIRFNETCPQPMPTPKPEETR